MATYDSSIAEDIKRAFRDAQALITGEIALAQAEAREEARKVGAGAALLAVGAFCGVMSLVLLLTTIALGLSEALAWPLWAGFGIVTVLTLIAAGVLAYVGWSRLGRERHMARTVDSFKESMKWMRARTS